MRRTKRNHKNIVAVIVFALILAFLVAGGTIAWLTRTSSLTNTFTVGSFTTPKTFPNDPTDPESETTSISINGNLYEPSWDEDAEHKLVPSTSYAKDPYVGIGAGSEDAVVYVNVTNNLTNKVYFTINDDNWTPVENCTTAGSATGTYTSGLFKYNAGLTASATADVWTTKPLFNEVVTDDLATAEDFSVDGGEKPAIVVTSFLHQAKDGNTAIDAGKIETAAKKTFKYINDDGE